jgi:shikimate dehydrogenase
MISLGLLGYPLSYSVSPRLHTAALLEMGIAGEYRLYPAPPLPEGEPGITALLDRVRCGEIRGLNVTIPHKQSVLPHLDRLAPLAETVGAVNTIYMEDGQLVGDNTDAPGFLSDLQRVFPGFATPAAAHSSLPRALVLGAGGAARAVVFVLARAGWQVTIAARRPEQAEALASALAGALEIYRQPPQPGAGHNPAGQIDVVPLEMAGLVSGGVQLVVNTTPVGMLPDVENNPWPPGYGLPQGAFVYDLIYKPPQTALTRAARRAGVQAANGLGMLVEQAALALEIWTGRPVPRRPLWQAVPEFHDESQRQYLEGL